MTLTLRGPKANEAGLCYVGKMKVGAMINTTFTVAQLIKLGREVPLKSKKFSCNGSVNNTALFFLDDPTTINNDFCSEDVYYFIFLKPFISISADTAIGFSMNFELQYNYSFWPEYNDVIL